MKAIVIAWTALWFLIGSVLGFLLVGLIEGFKCGMEAADEYTAARTGKLS